MNIYSYGKKIHFRVNWLIFLGICDSEEGAEKSKVHNLLYYISQKLHDPKRLNRKNLLVILGASIGNMAM